MNCIHNRISVTDKDTLCLLEKEIIYKIMKKDVYFENEKFFFNKIKNIPDYSDIFYTFFSYSPIQIGQIHHPSKFIEGIQQIEIIQNQYLVKYVKENHVRMIDFVNDPSNKMVEKYSVIIQSYPTLLQSLIQLEDLKIIHNNINLDSICIKLSNKKEFILTNFSHCIFDPYILNDNNHIYFNDYEPWKYYFPPEIHVLSFLQSNKLESLSEYNIEIILHDVMNEKNKKIEIFNESSFKIYHKKYFHRYVNKSLKEIKEDISKYWFTWDTYSFHFHLLDILSQNKMFNNDFFLPFVYLLNKYLLQVPYERHSNTTMTHLWNTLIDEIDYAKLKYNLSEKNK